ncbi:Protein of unknown function [Gryllus bimaculatus]|nr:Protein of unknown function [Gryllus bimaculatus]
MILTNARPASLIVYYVALSDLIDATVFDNIPVYLENICTPLDGSSIASHKWGTTLFYYGPVGCLMVCNIACLAITLRKVQRLRRGNSVLRREEDRRRQVPGNPPSTGSVTRADGGRSLVVDARTIKMYLKMLLMTGAIELGFEVILWLTSNNSNEVGFESRDYHFPYRTSGYIIDFLRAVCVTWLAAPESGYVGLILKRWKAGKK